MTCKVRNDNKDRKVAWKKGEKEKLGEKAKRVTRCVCGEVSAQWTMCRSTYIYCI